MVHKLQLGNYTTCGYITEGCRQLDVFNLLCYVLCVHKVLPCDTIALKMEHLAFLSPVDSKINKKSYHWRAEESLSAHRI